MSTSIFCHNKYFIPVVLISFIFLSLVFVYEIFNAQKEHQNNIKANLYRKDVNRFIAHAGGQINNHKYTNSLEAINLNYTKGFRLFELDIIRTSDNIYVAAHDWKHWAEITGYKGTLPPDRKTFKEQKIYQKYTALDMKDINLWFKKHSDATLVTDKVNTPLDFSNKFIDKNRLMMELFTWDAVKGGLDAQIKSAMPTGDILEKIKGDKVKYLKELGISDIASSRGIIYVHKKLTTKIVDAGINIYAFHLHIDEKDEKYIICEEQAYFYGMYADKWDFKSNIDCYHD
jgi:glycerophosphoryl diester phosphodiesterase